MILELTQTDEKELLLQILNLRADNLKHRIQKLSGLENHELQRQFIEAEYSCCQRLLNKIPSKHWLLNRNTHTNNS